MPELPEIEAYLAALRPRLADATIDRVRIRSVSVLRTYDPPIAALEGAAVVGLHRMGKRIVIDATDDLHLIVHLMVAGRLRWREPGAAVPAKTGLAAIDLSTGTLVLTEAGSRRRASMHLVRGSAALEALDPGGVEIASIDATTFGERLMDRRRTLKRALTDPAAFAGIGGAFADEILFEARLSPTQLTTNLDPTEVERLHRAAVETLRRWTELRIAETGDGFPEKMTAFHPAMAVHGKYRRPCPRCGTAVQRIVAKGRETNYCPRCQTGGRILADRALSRLLKEDRPRSVDDLEG